VCDFDGEDTVEIGLLNDRRTGINAYMSSNNTIVVFDNYGKDLGEIKTDEDIVGFNFVNGLISVRTKTQNGDKDIYTEAYYTPTGKKAVTNATKQSIE
jgi:hypothetical protein